MLKHFVALICIALTSVVSAKDVTLKGRVYDQLSGEAVAYANVYIDSLFTSAASGENGNYTLAIDKPGHYTVCVSHISFDKYTTTIELNKGENLLDIPISKHNTTLSQLVVTGTGTKHHIDKVPVKTEIISEKDIKALAGRGIEEVISQLSSAFDYVSSAMGTDIKINGLGSDYVLVLVDGKRLVGGTGAYTDLGRISMEDVEQIEIVKGASSTLYGSDAIAGVINIITKKHKKGFSISNSTRRGAYNDLRQNNTIAYSKDQFSGKTSFAYKQTDGWQLNKLEFNNKYEKNRERYDSLQLTYDKPVNKSKGYTINQNLSYSFSEKFKLYTDLSWYEKRIFFPFKGRMHNYYYNNRSAILGSHYQINKKDYFDFDFSYNNYLYYDEYPWKFNRNFNDNGAIIRKTFYPGDRWKNTDKTDVLANAKGVFHYKEKHKINTGAEWRYEVLEAKYRLTEDDVSAHTAALYAQDEYEMNEQVTFVAGLRAIYHSNAGFMATPKITTRYKQKHFTHRFSYANGFKSPTLKELYYTYESSRMGKYRLYLGNKDLKPQKSHYLSLSTDYKKGPFSTGISLYSNSIIDMIEYKIMPTSYTMEMRGIEETKQRYNINRAQIYGLDYHIGIKPFKQMSINAGYSYTNAKDLEQDIRLNGISEHSATFKAKWYKNWKKLGIDIHLSGVYKSDRFYLEEEADNEMVRSYADPYQLWKITNNLHLKNIKKTALTLFVGIDNIFNYVDNRPYGSHYGTLNPGRSIFFGLNMKFKK